MNESNLRDSLLKQNGVGSVEAELKTLSGLIETEHQRARRLRFWTLSVWGLWLLVILLLVMVVSSIHPVHRIPQSGAQTTTLPTNAGGGASTPVHSYSLIGLLFLPMLVGFFCLPVVGVILLVLTFLARRSANLNQVRASIAAVDARLRLLDARHSPPPGGSQP
jgi:hypothetical protein